jgi:hypothetical protein
MATLSILARFEREVDGDAIWGWAGLGWGDG